MPHLASDGDFVTTLILTVQQPSLAPLRRHFGEDMVICTKGHSPLTPTNVPETFFYERSHPGTTGDAQPFELEMIGGCLARLFRAAPEKVDAYSSAILDRVRSFLDSRSIDAMLFRTGPHLPHEIAFYLLAKQRGIKMGIFEETSYFDRAFLFPSIDRRTLPDALWSPEHRFALNGSQQEAIVDSSKLKQHYYGIFETRRNSLSSIVKAGSRAAAAVIKSRIKGTPLAGTTWPADNPLRPSLLGALDYWRSNISGIVASEKAYFGNIASPDIYKRLGEHSVVFYGNYAPERTVFPDSYPYHDFISALKLLQDYPDRIWREHPTQFTMPAKPYMLRGGFYKGPEFYDEVRRLGWTLGPLNYPSEAIIRSPAMIATLNGTVAFEALLKKRPLILFARNWYRDLPNVSGPEGRKFDLDYDVLDVVGDIFGKTFPRINFQAMQQPDLDAVALSLELINAQRIGSTVEEKA
jgi:hypothetical protein